MRIASRNLLVITTATFLAAGSLVSVTQAAEPASRERLLMDFGWRFAFGHPYDTTKDFGNGTGAFAYYDLDKKGWVAEAGDFKILVGSSSRQIRLQDTFELAGTTVEK